MNQLFSTTFFGNTVLDYLAFVLVFAAGFAALKITEHYLVKRLNSWAEKTTTTVDDFLVAAFRKNLMPILYFLVFYFSVKILKLDPTLNNIISMIVLAFMTAIAAMLFSSIAVYFADRFIAGRIAGENNAIALKWTNGIIKTAIWSIALILLLDNLGIRITSLITGLGIGGIALAFAAQAILVDIFCCFTIFFDKPFEIGDFIIVGNQMGTVEYIGMKTTRLRALNGEQLVIANSDLTNSRISNFKTMVERRVLFKIGVAYDTAHDKLKEIPELIRSIIEDVRETRFGRTHFSSFGPYSLDFEIAYYILSDDYDKYMDINQEINYRIKEEFDRRGIEFAFPTQTLHVYNPPVQGA